MSTTPTRIHDGHDASCVVHVGPAPVPSHPVTFTLTPADLAVDRHSKGSCCAIARAAKRVLGDRFRWVTLSSLHIDGPPLKEDGGWLSRTTELRLPPEVHEWNCAFVFGRPVEAITFELDIPEAPATP